jgi:hypothetical protein
MGIHRLLGSSIGKFPTIEKQKDDSSNSEPIHDATCATSNRTPLFGTKFVLFKPEQIGQNGTI